MAAKPERKSSRRSSILKLPKSRNPLQTVESVSSSPPSEENTPNKLKRRVSFAEKKHVKEFCDSMEQGTVWDDTYEETEISQTRSSHDHSSSVASPESTRQAITQEILNLPKTSKKPSKHSSSLQLNCSTSGISDKIVDKENIPMDPMIDLSISEGSLVEADSIPNNSSAAQKFQIYCDDENLSSNEEKDRGPLNMGEELGSTLSLPESVGQAGEMEVTAAIPSRSLQASIPGETQHFNQMGIEITEAIPSVITSTAIAERTQISQQQAMEMTEAVPSVLNAKKNLRRSVVNPRDMELTEAISSIRSQPSLPERTQVLHQQGMETTEAIPSVLNSEENLRRSVANPREMELTEAISSMRSQTSLPERTQVFHQQEMETTEAISSVLNSKKNLRRSVVNPRDMELTEAISSMQSQPSIPERTEVFHQQGMEMTEAISSVLNSKKNLRRSVVNPRDMEFTEAISSMQSQPSIPERTEVFHQQGMEMTEAISSVLNSKKNLRSVVDARGMELTEAIPSKLVRPAIPDGTQVFDQQVMEMTEAISSMFSQRATSDGTMVFNQNGMEITEAISSVVNSNKSLRRSVMHPRDMELTEAIPSMVSQVEIPEETQHSNQNNMEMTEAISCRQSIMNDTTQPIETHNYVPDLTEAIPTLKRPYKSIMTQNNDSSLSSPRAKILKDQLPTFFEKISTPEAAQRLHSLLHPESPTSSADLQNRSMEFTVAIPSNVKHQPNVAIPGIAQNDPMDKTEVIQSSRCASILKNTTLENSRQSIAILSSNCPVESSEVDSSDSFKDNMPPKDESRRTLSVVRPLFVKEDDDITGPTAVPLEGSNEAIEDVRFEKSTIEKNVEAVPCELTNEIVNDLVKFGKIVPKDFINIENIETPSFICENSFVESSSESSQDDGQGEQNGDESRQNSAAVEESLPKIADYHRIDIGNDEMTINLNQVALPEVEFTEEIIANNPGKTDVINRREHKLSDDEIAKKRRTYVVSAENTILQSQIEQIDDMSNYRRRTHTIRRHQEQECEDIQCVDEVETRLINPETSMESVEVDDHLRVEHVQKDIGVSHASYLGAFAGKSLDDEKNVTLDKRKIVKPDDYLRNIVDNQVQIEFDVHEVNSIAKAKIPEKDNFSMENPHKFSKSKPKTIYNHPIVVENDSIIKSIEKSKKLEEIYMQNLLKSQEMVSNLHSTSHKSRISKDNSELSAFEIMKKRLENFAESHTCLWKILRLTKERIFIEFKKTAFTFGCIFDVPESLDEFESIKKIFTIPRLSPEEPSLVRITDCLIVEKINVEELKIKFKTYNDVEAMIHQVTKDIVFVYDSYTDLKKMSYSTMTELEGNRVWFIVKTKSSNTLLKIFINIKSFSDIRTQDVLVVCMLGSVKTEDVRNLVKNVKRDHKFFTMYKNDVCDYLELMEEAKK